MDDKTNFSSFQFETQKLEAATAKGFAENYKQASQSYIIQLCKIDNQVLKKIREILRNAANFEKPILDTSA